SFTSYVLSPEFRSFPTRRSSDLPELEDPGLEHQLVVGAGDAAVESGVDAQAPRGLEHGGLAPRLRLAEGAQPRPVDLDEGGRLQDRKSTRLNSSHVSISYAAFCL